MSEIHRIVAISGSPREDSISRRLLECAMRASSDEGLETIEIDVRHLEIGPCLGCEACADGPCILDDDMGSVIASIRDADAVIVASPIYFSGPTSQLKALIDRCQPVWYEGSQDHRRPGGIILVGGSPEPVFRNAASEIASMLAVFGFDSESRLFVPGMDGPMPMNIMSRAGDLGRGIARRSLGLR